MITTPKPPYAHPRSIETLNLEEFADQIVQRETKRQEAFDLSRKIQATVVKARFAVDQSQADEADMLQTQLEDYLQNPLVKVANIREPRLANISNRIEDIVRLQAYRHFLKTGALLPPALDVTDEEYLAGACMGLCQDLQRYGLGRATVRDMDSVQAATDLVSQVLEFLLQLDFRNGTLRRKYDGCKYSLKALETLLYELSITGAALTSGSDEPTVKRAMTELLPVAELDQVKSRMEKRDEMREDLIKKSRDGQKAAKQAIFAMHRGDQAKAIELLYQCELCIQEQLWPTVQVEAPLRSGSFANVLEEFVEAKLFYVWLYGREESTNDSVPTGMLLKPNDFDHIVVLEPEEYLGGLADLTGEIGRFAVQRGTARDSASVELCYQTNSDILVTMESMERMPVNKKLEQVSRSVEKLERMLYEMSLSQASGGRNVHSEAAEVPHGEMEE